MTSRAAASVAVSVASVLCPASSAGDGWDPAPLPLTPESDGSPTLTPAVETTDDGATWVMWAEDPDDSGHSAVVVRRIDPAGVPGERRVLSTTATQFTGSVALAALPGGDVRVAYTTNSGEHAGGAAADAVEHRRPGDRVRQDHHRRRRRH